MSEPNIDPSWLAPKGKPIKKPEKVFRPPRKKAKLITRKQPFVPEMRQCACGCSEMFMPDRRTQRFVNVFHRRATYKCHPCPDCGGIHQIKMGVPK